jgi:DNA polymerase-3 subunit chi
LFRASFTACRGKFKQQLDRSDGAVSKRGVTEVFYYHLERQPLDRVLPKLLKQAFERGWRCVVQAGSPERVEALSSLLWTFEDDAFLPHGTKDDGAAELQPIWLTDGDDAPNGATVRFFVDGAAPGSIDGLTRAVIIFDGGDEAAIQQARDSWKSYRGLGAAVSYWQQDEAGRWQNRAAKQA